MSISPFFDFPSAFTMNTRWKHPHTQTINPFFAKKELNPRKSFKGEKGILIDFIHIDFWHFQGMKIRKTIMRLIMSTRWGSKRFRNLQILLTSYASLGTVLSIDFSRMRWKKGVGGTNQIFGKIIFHHSIVFNISRLFFQCYLFQSFNSFFSPFFFLIQSILSF